MFALSCRFLREPQGCQFPSAECRPRCDLLSLDRAFAQRSTATPMLRRSRIFATATRGDQSPEAKAEQQEGGSGRHRASLRHLEVRGHVIATVPRRCFRPLRETPERMIEPPVGLVGHDGEALRCGSFNLGLPSGMLPACPSPSLVFFFCRCPCLGSRLT